jgi:3-hydroxyisobutyrate dehydrogenase-like beta-hydroxyacid dehydrogenase
MLPRGAHVIHVVSDGPDSLLSFYDNGGEQNKLIIDCSTVDADVSRQLAKTVEKRSKGKAGKKRTP